MVPTRTGILGRAFDSTAASYKFLWFLAVLRLLPRTCDAHAALSVRAIVAEMIVIAWAPAALYRLSFGAHDRLQDAVRDLQSAARLRRTASEAQVRRALAGWSQAAARIDALSNLVPTRFLGPWLEIDLPSSIRDDRRTRAIVKLARQTLAESDGPPCAIERGADGTMIVLGAGWRDWLLAHQLILDSHAELALARFLQARNPHVPGITEKVRMPGSRKLAPARRMFSHLRARQGCLLDVYDGTTLDDRFAIDHVLPRAFVAHDLLWNLAPTQQQMNRDKGEALPDSSLLARIGAFQYELIQAAPMGASELEDYLAVFGLDEQELRTLSQTSFVNRYLELLTPLMLVAAAQGFRTHWRPSVTRGADSQSDQLQLLTKSASGNRSVSGSSPSQVIPR
jgi:hypothetical protein